MDWNRAININQAALTRVAAEIYAMLGVVSGLAIERMLRPAESALSGQLQSSPPSAVIPTQAGIQLVFNDLAGPRLRGDEGIVVKFAYN